MLDNYPVVGKDVVRKRAGGVFVNVEKRRRLTDDDLDADYVPPESETRRVSTSTSVPAPVAISSGIPQPVVSEFANFPEITEAAFVENFDDINLDLGPSSSQVNNLESQVASLNAKVASLTEEVERLKQENKNVDVLQAELVEVKAKEKEHFEHVMSLSKALFEQVEANKLLNRKVSKIMQGVLQVHENDLKLVLEALNLKSTCQGSYSCRSEDPVRRDEGDKDDDPAPQQPPSAEADTGKAAEVDVATTQGESGSGTADKGKGKEVVDEDEEDLMIDAMIDVDNVVDLDDVFDFVEDVDKNLKEDEFEIEPCLLENMSEDLDLEEGGWMPPKDFAEKNWDDIILQGQIERMVVETVTAMQSKRSFANPELRKEFEDRTVKKSYKNRTEAVRKILSWAYDQYLDVFMIKRLDGI